MIYSFASGDTRQSKFVDLLNQLGLGYELDEFDHTVVRVLGKVTPEIARRFETAGFTSRQFTFKRSAESGAFATIADSTRLAVIAGPCAVESEDQLEAVASELGKIGVRFLRGGAFKPRTQVDSFQGMGVPGLRLLREVADRHGMYVITEVMDRAQIDDVAEFADVLQVGSRNMYNYTLLTALGAIDRPVLLKRGMAATLHEWLSASDYIIRGGNSTVILCERGVRTFEPEVSHTFDLSTMILAQRQSGLPVIADPSHAAGRADLVTPLALAAVAAGADGVMVEVHPEPDQALSDRKQALTLPEFRELHDRAQRLFSLRANH